MRDAAAMIHSLWDALQKVYRKHLVCGTHAYITSMWHDTRNQRFSSGYFLYFYTSGMRRWNRTAQRLGRDIAGPGPKHSRFE